MFPIEKLIALAAQEAAEKTLNKLQQKNSTPEYFTTVEVAAYTGLSRQFFEIARHKGDGPPFLKIGSAVRYKRSDIDNWLLNFRRTNTTGGGDEK